MTVFDVLAAPAPLVVAGLALLIAFAAPAAAPALVAAVVALVVWVVIVAAAARREWHLQTKKSAAGAAVVEVERGRSKVPRIVASEALLLLLRLASA